MSSCTECHGSEGDNHTSAKCPLLALVKSIEPTYTVHLPGCMTGRDWYEKFETELKVGSISGARYAAARASGIDLDDINPDGSLKPLKSAKEKK